MDKNIGRSFSFIFAVLTVAWLTSASAAAGSGQEPTVPVAKTTSLVLGLLKSPPGNQVFMPMILTVAEGPEIGAIVSEITFPSAPVSFGGVTKGLSADLAKADVDTVVKPDEKDPANSTLKVTVTAKKGEAIPPGIVAYLTFNVSDKAEMGQAVPFKHTATALTADDPPKPLDSFVAKNGEIEVKVSDNPFYACFFYMH